MAANDPQLQMILGMLAKGRSHRQICDAIGITQDELNELLDADIEQLLDADSDAVTDAVTPDEALAWADSMTRPAMDALHRVLTDPKTPAAARLSATKEILSWRQELANRKAEGDRRVVYNILIENETLARMQGFLDIMRDAATQAALDDASQIMPNTTA